MPWGNLYLLFINLILFILMWVDKQRAQRQEYRIPERMLLTLGILGGGPAGWLAMVLFHHKTRKIIFHIIYWIGIGLVMLFLWKSSIITESLLEGMMR
ncbi:DUF1294 domain-containing protein [Aerococcaceae bacterium NML180378]|nr:DUF1294 domain-containing protein [Aerococcaceae bacterium NML180378]